jgi:DNA-binding beta-propeller fold protein YncE
VANTDNTILAFEPDNRTGRVVASFDDWPSFLFVDNRTSDLYVSVLYLHLVFILPGKRTIPTNGISGDICTLNKVPRPMGVVVDSVGNVYISSIACHWITRWAPNATTGVLIAGSPTGSSGSSSILLWNPYCLLLDEIESVIYVADRFNNRIQRFPLNGSRVGVTFAGGNNAGTAANQLYNPTDIYRSKKGDFMYICDSENNRVQRWPMNGTSGVTVVGSSSGVAGRTPYQMNVPYALAFDADERYMYVVDSDNNRIQRFSLQ